MRFAIPLLTFLALAASPAVAQTQSDLNQQAGRAFARADASLNDVYERLIATLSPQGKDALRQAQRTWITFRDQECEFETFGSRDGSVHPMVLLDCKARLTKQRIIQLKAQIECEEGDLACGRQ